MIFSSKLKAVIQSPSEQIQHKFTFHFHARVVLWEVLPQTPPHQAPPLSVARVFACLCGH